MIQRVSSLDRGYETGQLSLFPDALDDKDSLYEVKNNAETKLTIGLSYSGKKIVVESTNAFPAKGLLRIGPEPGKSGEAELVYYDLKTETTFKNLIRGFAGSKQGQWPAGSWATNAVTAEPHNAIKDALINIQREMGLFKNPLEGSLHKRIKNLEAKFYSPRALFRTYPKKAKPGQPIRFQNFSEGDVVRHLWDFGDGGQSVEKNPTYTYSAEGIYTVRLHIITSSGAQGISTKKNYLTISNEENQSWFYTKKISGLTYRFIDQTDGDVLQRYWVFGDGNNYVQTNQDIHEHIHTYENPGLYQPSLLVNFAGDRIKRVFLSELLEVK
jgi:PKD repeat protein